MTAGTRGGYTGARGKHGQRHKAAEMAAVPSGCVGGGARAEEARGAAELLVVAACDEEMREAAGPKGHAEEGPKQGKEGDGDGVEARCGRAGRFVLDEAEDAGRWQQVDAVRHLAAAALGGGRRQW